MTAVPDPAFCGCCMGLVPAAPSQVWNRPGLSQIAFRIGTFSTFREAGLEKIAAEPALATLTTRDSDDYVITVLELFAAVGDVLTFYNERIANELFLRSARERDSLLRLVRLIGYQLRPGLAATAMLAFRLDPGVETRIRRGLKVMSVPGQEERPQTFETLAQIVAHGDLNGVPAFAPAMPFNAFQKGHTSAPLVSVPEPLNVRDSIIFFGLGSIEHKTVAAREPLASGERLRFSPPVQAAHWWPGIAWAAKVERQVRFFGYNAPNSFQSYNANPAVPVQDRWTTTSINTSFGVNLGFYPLERRYDDLKPGTPLLIDAGPGNFPRLCTAVVAETRDEHRTLGNRAETVTVAELRRTIRGRPTGVATSAGAHGVLARGGAGTVFVMAGPSSHHLGDDFVSSSEISAVSTAPSRIDVFARDQLGRVATTTWKPWTWTPWTAFAEPITSAPKALVLAGGAIVVFARGLDLGLWVLGISPAFAWAPLRLGEPIGSDPAPVSWDGSRIDVFARGIDRGLWYITGIGGTWSEWQPLKGTLASPPAVASTTANRLDVVALDDDGSLIHRRWTGTAWSDWLNLGGRAKGTPAIAAIGADRVDIFVQGGDDQLWQITRTADVWSQWLPRGGSLSSSPDVALSSADDIRVYARDRDGSVAVLRWIPSGWQAWTNLGAGLGAINDRRAARIYQLADRDITFRDFDYPPLLTGGRVAVRLKPGQSASELGGLAQLAKGRRIVLEAGTTQHVATVSAATPTATTPGEPADHVLVDFNPPLSGLVADTVLRGNVVEASHGESQPDEVLGNGDASKTLVTFRLARGPLTYLPGGTKLQGEAALEIRVNGELWQEAASLYGHDPTERIYTARQGDSGETFVTFGDGRTGARLPTGAMNVMARYRRGLGREGRVKAGQLSILLERPPGLRDVTNLAADGGVDAESRDDARRVAPTTVRTFGRAVSLRDFEWLATSSGLVSRAYVTWVWFEWQRAVHLTVAGVDGTKLSQASIGKLHAALAASRDPNRRLFIANLVRVPLVVRARILSDPASETDKVLQAARAAIGELFAFETMALGAAVHASDVYAALQAAKGVRAVGLDIFQLKGFNLLNAQERAVRSVTAGPVQPHIRIFPARPTPDDPALIDRYTRAGFDGSSPPRALAAEQAFIENSASDIELVAVEAL